VAASSDVSQYEAGLARIRARRRRVWLVFFLYIPVVLVVYFVVYLAGAPFEVVPATAIAWMLLYAVVIFMAGYSRCPRCHGYFHIRRFWWHNPFARSCLNCRLPLRLAPPAGTV
jgi:hypothetical protein